MHISDTGHCNANANPERNLNYIAWKMLSNHYCNTCCKNPPLFSFYTLMVVGNIKQKGEQKVNYIQVLCIKEKSYCNLVNIQQNFPVCILIQNGVKKVSKKVFGNEWKIRRGTSSFQLFIYIYIFFIYKTELKNKPGEHLQ